MPYTVDGDQKKGERQGSKSRYVENLGPGQLAVSALGAHLVSRGLSAFDEEKPKVEVKRNSRPK